jgi:hypothetical protein
MGESERDNYVKPTLVKRTARRSKGRWEEKKCTSTTTHVEETIMADGVHRLWQRAGRAGGLVLRHSPPSNLWALWIAPTKVHCWLGMDNSSDVFKSHMINKEILSRFFDFSLFLKKLDIFKFPFTLSLSHIDWTSRIQLKINWPMYHVNPENNSPQSCMEVQENLDLQFEILNGVSYKF